LKDIEASVSDDKSKQGDVITALLFGYSVPLSEAST
jgi:hypothetical protein